MGAETRVEDSGSPGSAARFLASLLEGEGLPLPGEAVVLGSGQGEAVPGAEREVEVSFEEIPGWPRAEVPGHAGTVLVADYGRKCVLFQRGRLHYYEGLTMEEVAFPVRVLASLGVRRLLLCNAAGALNPAYEPGFLMLVRDHINLMGVNPLRGVRDADGTPAFVDLSDLYDAGCGDFLLGKAQAEGWPLVEGVLVAVSGPSYETGAELRFLRLIGGDAVSMSLVPEALYARHLGMRVNGVSVITNIWDLRRPHPVSHEEVLRTASSAVPALRDIIRSWLEYEASP
ncbi:purine-nucleoside phosphorylase [Candidatus Solincola tengchongensis]|uniref:purine-nucleoside phosphorylase n=1 Tax=Candidatus Solincola tengchongensis TaxID=2900693 RepID=UPI00257BAE92|nr:purine-nucleoside phosphorylase [Candidatus Solincola tengchongensis]